MGRRSEQRIHIRLPITVSGRDRGHQPFWQTAQTLDISRSGARLEGVPDCLSGPGVTVSVEYKGSTAHYLVVWVAPPHTPEAGQVGLRALDTNNSIWPVTFSATSAPHKLPNNELPNQPDGHAPVTRSTAQVINEQRQAARVPCRIDAEVSVAGTAEWLRGIASDVSTSGCYLEMMSPLPVGTPVDLVVADVKNAKIRFRGFVRHSDAPFGMGIEFQDLNEAECARLNQVIQSLQA